MYGDISKLWQWNIKLCTWFPRGLENLEKWGNIFQSEKKSGNFAKTGKVREFYPKYWEKSEKNYTGKLKTKKYWKVREICQTGIVKTLQMWYHTLNKKELKNTGKLRKILEKSGKFVSQKK